MAGEALEEQAKPQQQWMHRQMRAGMCRKPTHGGRGWLNPPSNLEMAKAGKIFGSVVKRPDIRSK